LPEPTAPTGSGTAPVTVPGNAAEARRFYLLAGFVLYASWLFVFDSVGRTASQLATSDPTLPADRLIPFVPAFVWPYLLGYLYPLLPFVALKDWHRFNAAILAVILANAAAYIFYFLVPLAFPIPDPGPGLSGRLLTAHIRLDFSPGANKLPSFHVASVLIAVLACARQRLGRFGDAAAAAGAFLVAVSTLFVKKHVVLDVLAGILLGALAWLAARKLYLSLSRREPLPIEAFKKMMRKIGPFILAYLVVLFALAGLVTGKVPPWIARLARLF
jgi:membrane-associated phospholipid phosphatase